ncbi:MULTISPECIES: DUF262 domain-containing protein [unclassified Mesorhizobium]|uniref:DUF262 domain-containing protein n=1 Tax=unclassified Mesorhizobium TaxID=325217 RepID=UPI000FD70FA1|nr:MULTISPECIES: DUF262 domain-containing protein [unclassified Mesorhizobium]TGR47219.1 DUF262 domain-containing protein [bacterium M00.F.Ca.ET.199.01.1.1]TGU36669.1 DUF262 domain-containing protein [bacterium M00.F.Ca.ET.156.01.1.1]TGV87857.1 DUF262 domain-containing protein [Mesorhizobium sp. M00.F.Ca.ET.149.01.1.1]TGR28931.1 DUF262 domain-containing protein [Mesorhizobium sp. M8A.F.Ca.ET.202.01.1.1]TGR29843.1 DUF262 domain-containing protein [Mesorhizobium sp. M8A.F.Ca.ET.197.01.1.1]
MAGRRGFTRDDIDAWFTEEEAADTNDVFRDITDPAEKYARSQLRVVRETKDYQLDYLQNALRPDKELIDTDPGYQRRLRWSNKKRSLLIESLLLNIPIPSVFLFETDYNQYEVIDGRQRLETINAFLSNNFSLTGLEYWSELNRKRFNDLPSVLQRGLLRRSISAVVLLAETTIVDDDGLDVRRVLFDRLNTGGIRLNPQELRNALYPGPLNALLIRLARDDTFTSVWGIPRLTQNEDKEPSEALLRNPLYASLADAELVLRFFALRDAIQRGGTGSLRRILDRFMAANANLDDFALSQMSHEYISLLTRLTDVFAGEPFRLPKTKRPSRPLYDALMIALSQFPEINIEQNGTHIRSRLQEFLSHRPTYDVLVGRGNTMESIRERVNVADAILRG